MYMGRESGIICILTARSLEIDNLYTTATQLLDNSLLESVKIKTGS